MISCDQAVARLYEFLDEELDEQWVERVRLHFEACKQCMPRVDFERAFLRAVQSTEATEATPNAVRSRLLSALADEGFEPPPK